MGVEVKIPEGRRELKARCGVILACGDYANNSEILSRFKGDEFSQIEGINSRALGDGHLLVESVGGALANMDVTYGPELRFVPSAKKPFQQWLPRTGWLAKLQGAVSQRMPQWLLHRLIKRLLVTWQHLPHSSTNFLLQSWHTELVHQEQPEL